MKRHEAGGPATVRQDWRQSGLGAGSATPSPIVPTCSGPQATLGGARLSSLGLCRLIRYAESAEPSPQGCVGHKRGVPACGQRGTEPSRTPRASAMMNACSRLRPATSLPASLFFCNWPVPHFRPLSPSVIGCSGSSLGAGLAFQRPQELPCGFALFSVEIQKPRRGSSPPSAISR